MKNAIVSNGGYRLVELTDLLYTLIAVFKRRNNSLLLTSTPAANVPNLTATQAKSYLWGATGEQEWTPAITTGMFA